jgi:translation initiation factor 2 alpha subunit (eIF-2alpha)
MELEVGDVVMCTVDRIERTTVFVKIHENKEGSIILSEIAPGRIRNLRDYVVPKKQIICKVLRINNGRIELSLRRVTQKEQKEVKEKFKQEKSYKSILKSILGENFKKIENQQDLYDLIEESKKNPKELEGIIGKENARKTLEIINSQKQKIVTVKKQISLKTTQPNGLEIIKEVLGNIKNAEVRYISAGKYTIKKESNDTKKADTEIQDIISKIQNQSKEKEFEIETK